jgi:NAD(P)-dependent dehydrogenase (short-subunit alcohol dehydrogenase family)
MILSRVAIVSGGSGGLGGAIVRRLHDDGFAVASCDVAEPAWSAGTGGPARLHRSVDVTDRAAVGAFVDEVTAELGLPGVVVTAAGVQRTGPSDGFADADWRHVLDVNLTGTWLVVQAALPAMLEQGAGRIVTISSEVGLAGLAGYAAYAASKGGVVALTKSLARELAPKGICVNSVAPGPIAAGMLLDGPSYDDGWLAANVPVGRWGRPEEVAATVALLVGEDGGYFVGQVLSPNGGTVI